MSIQKLCRSVLNSERDESLMGKQELGIFARTVVCTRKWTAIKTLHRFLVLCSLRVDVPGRAVKWGLLTAKN